MTALIPLHAANGSIRAYAIIDADDVPLIDQRRWVLHPDGYAQSKIDGVRQLMHRRLLGLVVGDFRKIDHINRNRLDNRRVNLRIVTDSGNAQNRTPQHKTSSFRGVVWHKTLKKWMAQAKVNQKNYYLGLFTDEREAAEAARAFRASHMPFSTD